MRAGAEDRFGFIAKKERHESFRSFLPSGGKDFPDHSFRFADPHVKDFGTFHVHEIFAHLTARFCASCFVKLKAVALPMSVLPQPGGP